MARKASDSRQLTLPPADVRDVALHEAARRRYLNYAMSVITARALPDARDGLKPVQRRILYTMAHELGLGPATKPLKCARIVGEVLGKFHPHGDQAVYDALVRMAQDFTLLHPLVDGHGNFGSLDGDPAAAYRYTEARLTAIAMTLLEELPKETVDYRPSYDGSHEEPVVLPARFPHLLVNGSSGIAVGMATNVPPHNLTEILTAAEALIGDGDLTVADLTKIVKGPDFPTGGQLLAGRPELLAVYENGEGPLRLRGEFRDEGNGKIIVTSIPYQVEKDALVRAVGELVATKKVPQLVDVRDESTTDVRVVLELRKDADADQVMAYLYKHTSLETTFHVNLTALVPAEADGVESMVPARLDLKSLLVHFNRFRYRVVERRYHHDLRLLLLRIHILEGFEKIFDALDEAIRIIRKSDGRADAQRKLEARFGIDDRQAEAVLELKLYRLARLEIEAIRRELAEKRAEAARIGKILESPKRLWAAVREELATLREAHAVPRRTRIGLRGAAPTEYDAEAFIADEEALVLLSRDGWVRRVGRVGDLSKVRLRPDDELLAVEAGNTKQPVVFLSSAGSAYTVRINDVPPSRGYGDPIQGLFKFDDRERAIAALSLDPKVRAGIGSVDDPEGKIPALHLLAVTSTGNTLRCSLAAFAETSTRSGRRYMRLKPGEEVVGVHVVDGSEILIVATRSGRISLFRVDEVAFLSGPGRGVMAVKLGEADRVIGSGISREKKQGLTVLTEGGRRLVITPAEYRVTGRGGRGIEVIKRGGLQKVERPAPELPEGMSDDGA